RGDRIAAGRPGGSRELFGPESLATTAPSNGGKRAASGLGAAQIRTGRWANPSYISMLQVQHSNVDSPRLLGGAWVEVAGLKEGGDNIPRCLRRAEAGRRLEY